MFRHICAAALLLSTLATVAHAANFSLTVKNDGRRVVDLGVFGYGGPGGGKMEFKIADFFLHDVVQYATAGEKIGFSLDLVKTAVFARQERNYAIKETKKDGGEDTENVCFVDDAQVAPKSRFLIRLEHKLEEAHVGFTKSGKPESEMIAELRKSVAGLSTTITIPDVEPGLYALFFYNCKKANKNKDPDFVTFTVQVSQYNIEPITNAPSFLSYGERYIPYMNFAFAGMFLWGLVSWHQLVFKPAPEAAGQVRAIHKVMYFLAVVKILTLLTNSAMLLHRQKTGQMNGGLDVIFYVVQTIKGIVLFSVILLLGTGWSLLKPFLSDRDRKILLLILPLQIFVNVALAMIEEQSEGSLSWLWWRDTLRVLDVVCCCAVLLPLVWSIKSVKDTTGGTDGLLSSARRVARLKQFRQFYIIAVAFIYTTRILVPYADGLLPYQHTWLSHFLFEAAAISFYTYTAIMFQPMAISRANERGDGEAGDEEEALPVAVAASLEQQRQVQAQMQGNDIEEISLDAPPAADTTSTRAAK